MARTFVWHPGRGPKKTQNVDTQLGPVAGRQLRIEQVRSEIGHPERLRLTLRAIGIRHHQDVVVKADSAGLRGQLKQVRHLVKVTPVEE